MTFQKKDNFDDEVRTISDPSPNSNHRELRLSHSDASNCRSVRKRRKRFVKTKADPSESFGDYVATKHRSYSSKVKSVVELMISKVLFDADMGKYDDYRSKLLSREKIPGDLLERSVLDLDEDDLPLETSALLSRAYSSDD